MELHLGLFASHTGSNVKAILEQIEQKNLEAEAKVLICNNPDAAVLNQARERSLPYFCINANNTKDPDKTILNVLAEHKVNLLVLAGYMKQLGRRIIESYPNRILNIHPSLLPKYGGKGMYGMRVHQAVIDSSDTESGATVHLVNSEYDRGRILAQTVVPRSPQDTAETLAERVLKVEHAMYSQVLKDIQKGIVSLDYCSQA